MSKPTKKVLDAQKKCDRAEQELSKAKLKLSEQQLVVDKKESELNKANVDYINLLLVEYNISMAELPDLLAQQQSAEHSIEHINSNTNSFGTDF